MNKEDLLKEIAKKAYNIGFGAKMSFASFELLNLISKVPILLSFVSIVIGILSGVFSELKAELLSALLLIFGVLGLLLGCCTSNKNVYEENGKELTKLFNILELLYFSTKEEKGELESKIEEFNRIAQEYPKVSISEQVFLSHGIAHYKFFWEHQIDWIDDELKFKLFRDKIPFSINCLLIIIILFLIGCGIMFLISLIK